jgi:hypothetical protein
MKRETEFILVPAQMRERNRLDYLPAVDYSKFMQTAEEKAAADKAAEEKRLADAAFEEEKQRLEEERKQKA